jgi:hypothetical protein
VSRRSMVRVRIVLQPWLVYCSAVYLVAYVYGYIDDVPHAQAPGGQDLL